MHRLLLIEDDPAIAEPLIESDGGRLELIQARPATFELYLRAAEGR